MKKFAATVAALAIGGAVVAVGVSGSADATTDTFYYNQSSGSSVTAGNTITNSVSCNSGDFATGGGSIVNSLNPPYDSALMRVSESYPSGSGGVATGWQVSMHNDDSVSRTFYVYVMCAH